jgi:hypothetical protein
MKRQDSKLRQLYWKFLKRYRPIRYLQRRSEETWKLFDADVAAAKTDDERQQVESLRAFECAEYDDEIRRLESQHWIRRGDEVHLSVYDIPKEGEHEEHWDTGPYGTRYLSERILRVFKKRVEDAEYERDKRKREGREIWIKYFTAAVAALAALASMVNVYLTVMGRGPTKP